MSEYSSSNVSELWDYLGTVWGNLSLEDKEFVEQLWSAYVSAVDVLSNKVIELENDRSPTTIDAVLIEEDNFNDVIYGTSDDDIYGDLINTYAVSGLICYDLEGLVISVSGIINYHYVDEENDFVAEALTEGVDYTLSGYNTLIFLNSPPFTVSVDYPSLYRSVIYIQRTEKVNPTLFRLWDEQVGFTSERFINEDYECWSANTSGTRAFENDKANHYKMIIEALRYWAMQKPTLTSIQNSLGISRGLPFSYDSGLVAFEDIGTGTKPYTLVVGDQILYFSTTSGLEYTISGQSVGKFKLLVDYFNLYDYTTSGELIEAYSDASLADVRNRLVLLTNSGLISDFPLSYNAAFYTDFKKRVVPKYMFLSEDFEPHIPPPPPWTPASITGVYEWWRTDLGISDGSAWVGQILGKTLTAAGAAQPTLTTALINGTTQNILVFDGAANVMSVAYGASLSQPNTIILVCKEPANGANYKYIYDDDDDIAGQALLKWNDDVYQLAAGTRKATGLSVIAGAAVTSLRASFNGASSSLYKNGAAGSTISIGTGAMSGLTLGGRSDDSLFSDIQVLDVIVINGIISVADLALLSTYTTSRYGVAT